jgi:long-chain acyl-CoA synthetase
LLNKSPAAKFLYIENLLKAIQKDINRQLPAYSQITSVFERREAFVKTATQKIKRYLYQ